MRFMFRKLFKTFKMHDKLHGDVGYSVRLFLSLVYQPHRLYDNRLHGFGTVFPSLPAFLLQEERDRLAAVQGVLLHDAIFF